MLSMPFNKKALAQNSDMLVYLSTTSALFVMLTIYGTIQGTLKFEFFIYAIIVSVIFSIWTVIDHKYRQS